MPYRSADTFYVAYLTKQLVHLFQVDVPRQAFDMNQQVICITLQRSYRPLEAGRPIVILRRYALEDRVFQLSHIKHFRRRRHCNSSHLGLVHLNKLVHRISKLVYVLHRLLDHHRKLFDRRHSSYPWPVHQAPLPCNHVIFWH